MKCRNQKICVSLTHVGIAAVGAALVLCVGCAAGRLGNGFLPSGKMPLADGGKPLADIVIAPDADKNLQFAAEELKLHLDKITGGDFSIVTQPSEGRKVLRIAYNPKLGKQELSIAFSNAGVALEGGGFPEYAVWDFLRDYCGVKWLDPTDAGTIIPSDPNLAVKRKDRKDKPFAKGRNPTGNYAPELWGAGSPGWTNYLQVAYPSAFANGNFAAGIREVSRRKTLFLRRMKAGGEIANANHSFYWWYDRFLDKQNPRLERFRPELFAKGYEKSKEPPQLCYSNPEVISQTVADIRDYFDNGGYRTKYRNIGSTGYLWGEDVYCVEPMDNKSFCKCEECSRQYRPELADVKAQHSDYWFHFVNTVAKEIAKSHPDKKISTLAYGSRCGVPSFKLEPNVVVHFCFTCNRMPYAKRKETEVNQLRDWRAAYPKQPFGLWLYNTFPKERADRVTHVNCFPGFFAHVLKDEYELLDGLDISENIFNCGFVDDYENYLSLMWMWNPKKSFKTLEAEYFSSYGAAATPIKKFYDIVEERYCNPTNYPVDMIEKNAHQTARLAWGILGTGSTMKCLESLIAEAEYLADTPMARARVANWKAGIWDYMRHGAEESRDIPSSMPGVTIRQTIFRGHRPIPIEKDILRGATVDIVATNGNWLLPRGSQKAVWNLKGRKEFTDGKGTGMLLSGKGACARYVINQRIDALRRFRVTIEQDDALRSRSAFSVVGLVDGKWVSITPMITQDAYSNWSAPRTEEDVMFITYDFNFDIMAVANRLDAIAIDDVSPSKGWIWPRYVSFEAENSL